MTETKFIKLRNYRDFCSTVFDIDIDNLKPHVRRQIMNAMNEINIIINFDITSRNTNNNIYCDPILKKYFTNCNNEVQKISEGELSDHHEISEVHKIKDKLQQQSYAFKLNKDIEINQFLNYSIQSYFKHTFIQLLPITSLDGENMQLSLNSIVIFDPFFLFSNPAL